MEDNLFNLQSELEKQNYCHSQYQPFIVYDPKKRRIHKATVKDRIVHQAVVNIIEPIFEKQFIFDSFSCRTGKGIHGASYRLRNFLLKASQNNAKTVYALKCDISKFFDSIDHNILLDFICRQIKDEKTIRLLRHIIGSFSKTPNKGLPLGNLTSQLFANIYLNELDYFIKHNLREKWYLRYCDDFLIINQSRHYLFSVIPKISIFLNEKLKLKIHPTKISIRSWSQGIDSVGYVHLPYCVVLRTKTKHRLLHRINSHNFSSYSGVCQHADTFELKQLTQNKIGKNH